MIIIIIKITELNGSDIVSIVFSLCGRGYHYKTHNSCNCQNMKNKTDDELVEKLQ